MNASCMVRGSVHQHIPVAGSAKGMARRAILRVGFLAAVLCTGSLPALAQSAAVIEGKDAWLFPGWESLDKVDTVGITKSVDLIAFANKELEKKKIGLVVAVAPMKAPFHQDKLSEGTVLSKDFLGRYEMIQKAIAGAGVQTADLAAAMQKLPADQGAFFRADYHWTGWAAEISAQAVASVIKAKWTLKGKAGDGVKLGEWVKERRFGDLAANFMTPEQRKEVGREIFTVRRDTDAASAGGGLLDDRLAPVQVIGNSFVQPYLGFPQALSNALDRRVAVTWNPGDTGPWATLLQYLESDDFKSRPAQVIVWQFNEGQMQQAPDAEGKWVPKAVIANDVWQQRLTASLAKLP